MNLGVSYESKSMLSIPESFEFKPSFFSVLVEIVLKGFSLKAFVPGIPDDFLFEDSVGGIDVLLGLFVFSGVVVSAVEGSPECDGP